SRTISLQVAERCPACAGTGSLNRAVCQTCHGLGLIQRQKTLDVNIPKGVREGSIIRLAGQGEPGTGKGPAGDLFLRVKLESHPFFTLIGTDDIQIELPVAPWEA